MSLLACKCIRALDSASVGPAKAPSSKYQQFNSISLPWGSAELCSAEQGLKELGLKVPLVGHLMLIFIDPLDATTFGAVNSTKSPKEKAQGSGWHIGGVQNI